MKAEEFPIVLFSTPDGDVRVNAVLRNKTLWLTQKAMGGLFGVGSQAITKHLKNIYATGELRPEATCSKMEQVQNEGGRTVSREVVFYNLDAIVAVGYRVNSFRATQFRIWATGVLTEFIAKGFVLDDERLKSDVTIAKNYLTAAQVKELESAVVGYFDYIERIVKRRRTFTMRQFAESVNAFLEFNEYEILDGAGSVSRAQADEKARAEYDEFNKHQRLVSDFDRQVKRMLDGVVDVDRRGETKR